MIFKEAKEVLNFFTMIGFLVVIFLISDQVMAQVGEGLSPGGSDISAGDLIDRDPVTNSFSLSQKPASEDIFGVIVERPAMAVQGEGQVSLLRSGQAEIKISTYNGVISAGDVLTSSPIPGVSMKADEDHDYIVGIALRSFNEAEAESTLEIGGQAVAVGTVLVDLRIGYRGLIDDLPTEIEEAEEPSFLEIHFEDLIVAIIRYFLAAVIALGSLFGAYRLFQNNLSGGVVALGRNPMAQAPIKRMMVMNVVVVIVIALGGLTLAAFMVWM